MFNRLFNANLEIHVHEFISLDRDHTVADRCRISSETQKNCTSAFFICLKASVHVS